MVLAPSSTRSVNEVAFDYLVFTSFFLSYVLSSVGEFYKLPRSFQYKSSSYTPAQLLSMQFLRFVQTKIDYRVDNAVCQRSRPNHPQLQESQFSREQ